MQAAPVWTIDTTARLARGERLDWDRSGVLVALAPRRLAQEVPLSLLAAEERARHERFRRPQDRQLFRLAHGLKRLVIARLLDVPPAALRFATASSGKPDLRDGALRFNLSHGGDWVALAVAGSRAVGIDVEAADRDVGEELAGVIRHPDDRIVDGRGRGRELLVAWTVKEAIGKCAGFGIRVPFRELPVVALRGGLYRGAYQGERWGVRQGLVLPGGCLAVAVPWPPVPMTTVLFDA